MNEINGKILVTTDWHIGLKQNSKLRLNIVVKVVKELIKYIKANGIKTLVFCGDLFHERISVNVNSLNVALTCIQAISKHCKTYLIVGNHDSHLKNSIDINSLNVFKDTPNVVIVDKPMQVSINGNNSLLVPWLGELSSYEKETFDMLFGHFDVSQEYLMKSYVKDNVNSINTSNNIQKQLSEDNMLENRNVGYFVGDFVDVAKKDGIVFSGHIHGRKELISKGRKFILVGDPYQQNLGERHNKCGFYVIDEDNTYKFVPIDNVPKHINIRMSKIVEAGIDNFDFSIVKGNILHKIYDIDIDILLDAKISQKINDRQPYEELLPDYEVDMRSALSADSQMKDMQTSLVNKSKLDYVKNYINNIDKQVLDEQGIEASKLYAILEEYYNNTIEEK